METNRISILRKEVVTNIPMFSDDKSGNPQNNWVKLYDLDCVDYCPGMTAKVYNLEHDPNYSNQNTTFYIEFHFVSDFQTITPPYDIKEGDYVGYKQQDQVNFLRIVRTIVSPVLGNCCDYQLICNVTTPRETERIMSCGALHTLEEEDYGQKETVIKARRKRHGHRFPKGPREDSHTLGDEE